MVPDDWAKQLLTLTIHFKCIVNTPANSGSSHYNFKGTYSIVTLAVVDAYYRIMLVDCGGKGRISGSGMGEKT
ncbi:hypothetical protein ANCDUO_05986 [Ancylostoma duodenale]|uniref:Uncharacterized protein n=1 Tax=Ancylostoma duodenale TaxID=51022 RepID=A0A0C2D2V2_9BILA|nr:hypothetical protein ANCDUO_05986 [Ancylostoma duodenale]